MNRIFIFLFVIAISATACSKNEVVDQGEVDRLRIEEYLTANNLTAQVDPSGLHYIIEEEGTGLNPMVTDSVEVRYKGYLLNGTVFDQTQNDDTATFLLGNLIYGWQIAIPLLKEGGKGIFIHPSALAYGPRGAGNVIGPNEVLVFEIELVSIRQ